VNETNCLLVRHGETWLNQQARLQGASDAGLSSAGRAQLATVAATLPDVARVYSSRLLRAVQSADIVAHAHGADLLVDDRLGERSFGELEGAVIDELVLDRPDLARRIRTDPNFTPASGESQLAVAERAAGFLTQLAETDLPGWTVVIVHGGWFRIAMRHVFGRHAEMPATGQVLRLRLTPGDAGLPGFVGIEAFPSGLPAAQRQAAAGPAAARGKEFLK
jgi:broad specificity phosphatase PhoE